VEGEIIFYKDIVCVLTQEGSALYREQYYVFDKQDELLMVNLDLIKKELCKRASKCKGPSSSKFHHGNCPFYIKCDGQEIGIFNKNEKQVVILPYEVRTAHRRVQIRSFRLFHPRYFL
jgi:hypothetical protein